YFVSNRTGGTGSDDIYSFSMNLKPVCGMVTDSMTGQGIDKAMVSFLAKDGFNEEVLSDADGAFCLYIRPGREYLVEGSKEGYIKFQNLSLIEAGGKPVERITMLPVNGIELDVTVSTTEGAKIANATATVMDMGGKTILQKNSNAEGFIQLDMPPGKQYLLKISKASATGNGMFKEYSTMVSTIGLPLNQKLNIAAHLENTGAVSTGPIPEIYFDAGSSEISAEGRQQLDKVIGLMQDFPASELEVNGYADMQEGGKNADEISVQRVLACLSYFENRGIDKKRFIAAGYGNKKPKKLCPSPALCTDADRAANRRVEFVVLKVSGE
ncbi:MAG TPA: OmpA family protein, partial [Chitinophagales bacterium]|nr:OmpA family protein [Chitinophagales bacterium]